MIPSDEGLFNPRVGIQLRLAGSEAQNPHSYFLKTCHAKRDKIGSKVQLARHDTAQVFRWEKRWWGGRERQQSAQAGVTTGERQLSLRQIAAQSNPPISVHVFMCVCA